MYLCWMLSCLLSCFGQVKIPNRLGWNVHIQIVWWNVDIKKTHNTEIIQTSISMQGYYIILIFRFNF